MSSYIWGLICKYSGSLCHYKLIYKMSHIGIEKLCYLDCACMLVGCKFKPKRERGSPVSCKDRTKGVPVLGITVTTRETYLSICHECRGTFNICKHAVA